MTELHDSEIDLSATIPGFAHGMKGMRKKSEFLGKFYGKRVADYLAKSDLLDLQVVRKNLNELYRKTSEDEDLTENEKRALNRVHWNILFSKGYHFSS